MTRPQFFPSPQWLLAAPIIVVILVASALATSPTETVLYRFQGGTDGDFPLNSPLVVDHAGNLYGTTPGGGDTNCTSGCGTVFQLSPPAQPGGSGTETVLYRFQGGADGSSPTGVLLDAHGNLIGTTLNGGSGPCTNGCGTLFQLSPPAATGGNWTKSVLYEFPGGANGFAIGGLIADSAGNLYGVNIGADGAGANGAVAELTLPGGPGDSWTETVLYRFKGVPRYQSVGDGSRPLGLTFDREGNLFGATFAGGFCQLFEGGSCFGTVFELTPPAQAGGGWTESVVYRFRPRDQNPTAGVAVGTDGSIYGVTYVEVYQVVAGRLIVLHNYGDNINGNGKGPEAAPILDRQGNVYGTTCVGGQFDDGIAFKLEPPGSASAKWKQVVLHDFAGGSDGWCPLAPMIFGPGGVLYGTTNVGGSSGCIVDDSTGCGTVFEIAPY